MAREGSVAKMWDASSQRMVAKGERVGAIPCVEEGEGGEGRRLGDTNRAVMAPGDEGKLLPKRSGVGTDTLPTEEAARASPKEKERGDERGEGGGEERGRGSWK